VKFKLDENMPEALVQLLTTAGHDVETDLDSLRGSLAIVDPARVRYRRKGK
jgi:hypothetical protein